MKFYIAGITLGDDFKHLFALQSPVELCNELVKTFPAIIENAKIEMGNDVITIITLHEYALTNCAIDKKTKNVFLDILQKAISQFENVILIPGSFAYYGDLNSPEKVQAIESNYETLNKSAVASDMHFKSESHITYSLLAQHNRSKIYLENSAYLLTNNTKEKHKKTFPFQERNKISLDKWQNSIFYLGTNASLKSVSLGNTTIDINILICRDHHNLALRTTQAASPHITVIVSDTLGSKIETTNRAYGALTIHMDSYAQLAVYLNQSHPYACTMTAIKARHLVIQPHLILCNETPVTVTNPIINTITMGTNYNVSKQDQEIIEAIALLHPSEDKNKRERENCGNTQPTKRLKISDNNHNNYSKCINSAFFYNDVQTQGELFFDGFAQYCYEDFDDLLPLQPITFG